MVGCFQAETKPAVTNYSVQVHQERTRLPPGVMLGNPPCRLGKTDLECDARRKSWPGFALVKSSNACKEPLGVPQPVASHVL